MIQAQTEGLHYYWPLKKTDKIKGKKHPSLSPEHAPSRHKRRPEWIFALVMNPVKLEEQAPTIPTECPKSGCTHSLPEGELSTDLARLFFKRQKMLATSDHQPQHLDRIETQICDLISWERKQQGLLRLGRKEGWPLSLDFNSIVTKTLQRKAPKAVINQGAGVKLKTIQVSMFETSRNTFPNDPLSPATKEKHEEEGNGQYFESRIRVIVL
ncbi:hypothetical protein B0H13DRAFT_1880514 [Mycena leptocephala]|nr:hypothetical protein B0H13DRAFT_1880514 [Mycena leptocephala]